MNPYKLQVKLGQAEFNAEGPEEAVKLQFEQFLEAVSLMQGLAKTEQSGVSLQPNLPLLPPPQNGSPEISIDPNPIQRAFAKDSKGLVSLRVLPNGGENRDADALLLLIYGFQVLSGQHDVSALQLMAGAKQSGLKLERIDRTIATHDQYVRKGGFKRGTRYSLNNQGKNRAEQVLKEMLA